MHPYAVSIPYGEHCALAQARSTESVCHRLGVSVRHSLVKTPSEGRCGSLITMSEPNHQLEHESTSDESGNSQAGYSLSI